jgi:hypothetical protein
MRLCRACAMAVLGADVVVCPACGCFFPPPGVKQLPPAGESISWNRKGGLSMRGKEGLGATARRAVMMEALYRASVVFLLLSAS